jgi:hypothetical protein
MSNAKLVMKLDLRVGFMDIQIEREERAVRP